MLGVPGLVYPENTLLIYCQNWENYWLNFQGGSRQRHFPIFHPSSSPAVASFLGPRVTLWRKAASCGYPPSQPASMSFVSLFSSFCLLFLNLPRFLSGNTDVSWFLNVEFDSSFPLFGVIFERRMVQKHIYSTILKWKTNACHGLNCGLPAHPRIHLLKP